MNLSDTVATFQADCELVHEFAKGDKTVIVHGTAGSYPSLAKIAADSQVAISGISTIIGEYEEQLDVSQAALTASNEALAGLFHLASGIVGKTFHFESTMELRIKHNMNTKVFTESIVNLAGDKVYAPCRPIDNTEFVVEFTDPEAGMISVLFYLNA